VPLTDNWLWLDFNGDRQVSLDDVTGWFFQALFMPGDLAIDLLIAVPTVASWLDIGSESYGGITSKTVSVMFWIAVLIGLGAIYNAVRDLDRAVTAFIAGLWQEFTRRLRVARRLITSWIGMQVQRRKARVQRMEVDELRLEKLEQAVLRCYASLGEERTLGATDVCRILRVSPRNAQKSLLTLVKYRLLQPVFETSESVPAYQITQAGQIFLLER